MYVTRLCRELRIRIYVRKHSFTHSLELSEYFNFKSGCVVWVENAKMRHQKRLNLSHLYSSKRCFSYPLILTRQSALVLKVDVVRVAKYLKGD